MNKLIESWKTDKKFRTKIKLLAYTLFVVIISIYAISLDKTPSTTPEDIIKNPEKEDTNTNTINLKDNYYYTANVKIDNEEYKYIFIKENEITTIIKEHNNMSENYQLKDNKYYKLQENNEYVLTTKEEIFSSVNYDYLNINNINTYLKNATKTSDQYIVNLKDIILGDNSTDYFVILINNNKISIDYTPLIKHFNNQIKTYTVDITINEGLKETK